MDTINPLEENQKSRGLMIIPLTIPYFPIELVIVISSTGKVDD
jgi:hypothetical protein